jgi:hypothetical protein
VGEEDDCAKQSQSEGVSSATGSVVQGDPPCETKPMDCAGAVCGVPARASEETPCGVTTSEACPAKQSQHAGSATGIRGVPRALRRVAWHYHDVARSS